MIKKIFTAFLVLTIGISTVFAGNDIHSPYFKNKSYYKRYKLNRDYTSISKYDFSDFAKSITTGCNSDYEKIRAIYSWICDNIAYDTSYEIYTADECIEQRKGVCQAYCDLFYHLAEAVDVRVEIIDGETKDFNGKIARSGHAWLFAYTDDNYGILLDPTWGAGSVDGRQFVKSDNCWIWFGVDPEWMILSHFPTDVTYQLLENPVSYNKFASMKAVNSIWLEYGLKVDDIYEKVTNDELSLPTFYGEGEGTIWFLDIPMQESLKIGNIYTFRVKLFSEKDIAIINDEIYCTTEEWNYEGDNIYSIDFMPRATGNLSFNIQDHDSNIWHTMIQYDIDNPSQLDWDNVRKRYPLSLPEIKNVKNLYDKEWSDAGIDNSKLVELIKENNVKTLPILYTNKGKMLKIEDVPMNAVLTGGQTYTFSFYPQAGIRWAIVNDGKWHTTWNIAEDGRYSMTLAVTKGDLVLYVQENEGESYSGCLGYEVR